MMDRGTPEDLFDDAMGCIAWVGIVFVICIAIAVADVVIKVVT